MVSATIYNAGCLVGYFEREDFGKACEVVEDTDGVCLEFESYGEGAGGVVGLVDVRREQLTGAEFRALYGGDNE